MRQRLPLILSAAALVVACLGVTGLGQAAISAIPPFAKNAGTVNHIKASRLPKKGQLLALGRNKKFPKSVLPLTTGPRGAAGPAGPGGAPGPKGDTGPAGSATAFARVAVDGSVDPNLAKGIATANIFKPGAQDFCFSGISPAPKTIHITLALTNGGLNTNAWADMGNGAAFSCPANTQAFVFMSAQPPGSNQVGPFFVEFN